MSNDKVEPTFKSIELDEKMLNDDEDSEQVGNKIYPERGRYQDKPSESKTQIITPGESSAGGRYNSWRDSHTRDYSVFLSVIGRLDRFRAGIGLMAVTFLSILFISAMDQFVKLILLMFNKDAVQDNGFQIKPIVYIVIGLSFWFLSVLIIAMGRLRDINKSPWLSLILFIPLVQLIIVYFCILPGSKEDNRFGPPPQSYGVFTYVFAATFLIGVPMAIFGYHNEIVNFYFKIVDIHKHV